MAKRKKLTDLSIENMKAPAKGRREIWDPQVPGFGLRLTGGTKAFQLMYRFSGELRRLTIGRYPIIGLADAREKARAVLKLVDAGTDPKLVEEAAAAERAREQADTFGAVCKRFIDEYAKPNNRSWREVERYFERDLADWKDRPIASISRRDVIAAIDAKARSGGRYAANRLLAHTRKLFNWALGKDIVAASPVVKVPAAAPEKERERELAAEEIKALWGAWETMAHPFGPMLKLLLITAQRRDEVAGMRWADLDPDLTLWRIPGEVTKNGKPHEVPLSLVAREVLASIPHTTSPFVFPARGHQDRYASGFSRAKARCVEITRVKDWRIHDLRRTAGTGMARAGIAVSTISRVLNHAEGGVTKIYNRYGYGPEKRHALETWARVIEGIVRPSPANVVELRAAQ